MQHILTRKDAGMVEQLVAKTQFWEQDKNKVFYYDEVRAHVLQTELRKLKLLKQYVNSRISDIL
jgi:hypothetical protein